MDYVYQQSFSEMLVLGQQHHHPTASSCASAFDGTTLFNAFYSPKVVGASTGAIPEQHANDCARVCCGVAGHEIETTRDGANRVRGKGNNVGASMALVCCLWRSNNLSVITNNEYARLDILSYNLYEQDIYVVYFLSI